MAGALARQAPPADAAEPNEDVRFVDGRAFGEAATPLFRKNGRAATVSATADAIEDPIDVYRIKVRAGSRAKIRLAPSVGDPDLYVFRGGATVGRRAPLARSRKGTGRRRLVRRCATARAGPPRTSWRSASAGTSGCGC